MHKIKKRPAKPSATGGAAHFVAADSSIFKSGNSLAFRVPSLIAKQLHLQEGASVEMAVRDDELIVRRKSTAPTLDELLALITPENLHGAQFSDLLESERW